MVINPKFKLKDLESTVPTSIHLKIYFDGKRIVYGLGKLILPELWDFTTERPSKNRHYIKKAEKKDPFIKITLQNLTNYINSVDAEMRKYFNYLEQQQIYPTKELIHKHLDKIFKPEKAKAATVKEKSTNLNQFIQQFIKEIESGKRTTKAGKQYAKGTIKNYLNFQAELNEYQIQNHLVLDFNDITLDFRANYIAYFNSKRYSPNTIGRHIKQIKVIMKAAYLLKLHTNVQFMMAEFSVMKVASPAIYLNMTELKRMAALDLSESPTLEVVRDVFLVGCFTAQRYSDYSRISASHIKATEKGNEVIELIQIKTSKKVFIPVHSQVKKILAKYGGVLPKTHEQKVNSRIKEVGKLAGITQIIQIEEIKGGVKEKVKKPKHDLIMTHTARRSGATNMRAAKMGLDDIRNVTGHSSIKQLETYLKTTKEETADRIALNPFFTGKKENNLKAIK